MYSLGAIPSGVDQRDYSFPKNRSRAVLPTTLDLSNSLCTVRDQGQQGTCVAQAGACSKEYQERREINFKNYLSPQFVYNCRANYPAPGMSGRDLMKILSDRGIAQENRFKYGDMTRPEIMTPAVLSDALNFRIKSYAQVKYSVGINGLPNYSDNLINIKQALVDNGPCVMIIPVYNYSDTMWSKTTSNDMFIGYHGIAVVGYDGSGLIIRNSWGTGWGTGGYSNMSYSDYNKKPWIECWTMTDDKSNVIVPAVNGCSCVLL